MSEEIHRYREELGRLKSLLENYESIKQVGIIEDYVHGKGKTEVDFFVDASQMRLHGNSGWGGVLKQGVDDRTMKMLETLRDKSPKDVFPHFPELVSIGDSQANKVRIVICSGNLKGHIKAIRELEELVW